MQIERFYRIISKVPYSNFVILLLFFLVSTQTVAQEKKRVEILNSGYGESVEGEDVNTQRLVDSVYIRHKEILMWCDTAYIYSGSNKVDAAGKVHIKQGDTLHLYANNVFYNGDTDFARAWGDVRLINKSTTIYSDTLDYDLANNISYYDDNGRIVDSTTTLTSKMGVYYLDLDQIFFYDKVVAFSDDFTLNSDTVKYETETGKIFVEGPSTIRDSTNTLYTESGWYDSNTGEAQLEKKSIVFGESQQLQATNIYYNKESGDGKARGSVRIEDMENKSVVLGNVAEYNESMETAMVTDSVIYMVYSDSDTLYLHADTLRTVPDTIEGEKIVKAYYGVRFYRDDIQGLCDSLVYFTKDSVIQMHHKPVIWSEIHQLSAELIEMRQVANGPDELHLTDNSFIISEMEPRLFDQIKGKELIGYIENQKLNKINVNGNGQTLYYAREDEQIIGLNRAESSRIQIRFLDGKIHNITFLKQPEGELKPLSELTEMDKKLRNFDWKIDQRPKSRHDIFPKAILMESEDLEDVDDLEIEDIQENNSEK